METLVTLHVNGTDVTGTVSGGKYSIAVDGTDLKADTNVKASVTATDAAGNAQSAALDHGYTVDTDISATADTLTTDEDHIGAISGNVLLNDDHGNGEVVTPQTLTTTHGDYVLKADGSYTFTINNTASQSLGKGNSATDILTYTLTDKAGNTTTSTLTTTITGTDDAPVLTHKTDSASLTEDGSVTSMGGDMHASDVDSTSLDYSVSTLLAPVVSSPNSPAPASPVPGTSVGHYGTMTVDQNGHWSYQLSHAKADSLNDGQKVQEVFTLTVADADGKSAQEVVTINITGTEDKPVVNGTEYLVSGVEDQAPITLHVKDFIKGDTDVDSGETQKLSIEHLNVDRGSVSGIDSNGNFIFTAEANYSGKVTFTYDVTDGHAGVDVQQSAEMTLAAVQDAAVITQTPVDVTEDTKQTATITLGITDSDAGEDHFTAGTITGAHGSATLATDGTLVYTLDNNAAQNLAEGEKITDTITVTSADGTTKDVVVSITGTNDNPSSKCKPNNQHNRNTR